MDRRKFIKGSALMTGLLSISPMDLLASGQTEESKKGQAKNIIFMISDGMSSGTLSMANLYSRNILGRNTCWMNLYLENRVARALMDTASASSIVTDSAAASSAFGGGVRVKNGVLNVGANGERHMPIWQKFKNKGKKAGCVTTVTITHATPAGFCINSEKRNAEPEIAEMYAEIGFDVMMGGGDEFFNPEKRTDKKDLYAVYKQKGYQVLKTRADLSNIDRNKKILGVYNTGALPFDVDRAGREELQSTPSLADMTSAIDRNKKILGVYNTGALPFDVDRAGREELQSTPSLADMTSAAINHLKDHPDGFVLQVEGGKVDWAAHANDISALIHDQLAFDEAVKTAVDFAEKDGNTLVVITTDHGNANPGTIYGAEATANFDSIAHYKFTNEYILNSIHANHNLQQIKDWIFETNRFRLTDEEAKHLLGFYQGLEKEDGLYNY
ncbi:MAG: alkaline phosphatase, partial [Weeksellaceae bacterium]|nr:alkaline phosphatase [Weeksellaceae bacterium]